jgi:AraC-like DNA-binding protein
MFHRDDPRERLALHRPPALPGVEILSAHGSSQAWHVFHEHYDICACRAACAPWRYRGRNEMFVDRSVGLMEPGELHCNSVVHKPAEFKVVMIDPELFMRAAREAGMSAPPHFRAAQTTDPRLFSAIYRFCHSVESGAEALEQESHFAVCVRMFLTRAEHAPHIAGPPQRRSVQRVKRHLLQRFSESVSLQELAAVGGLSRFHLLREFTREIGMPPHAYQVHVRVEHARLLIRRGTAPAEAAMLAGFADQSHLNRHFRDIWGITSGAYARIA